VGGAVGGGATCRGCCVACAILLTSLAQYFRVFCCDFGLVSILCIAIYFVSRQRQLASKVKRNGFPLDKVDPPKAFSQRFHSTPLAYQFRLLAICDFFLT